MRNDPNPTPVRSPFHAGEQEIQSRVGKRQAMETFGRRVIRRFMPDQHRTFFEQLPFLVVGSVDAEGWPWASIVPGKPGFISSPDPTHLSIGSLGLPGDPLSTAIKRDAPVGLLGIEMPTRRRNRMNGRIEATDGTGFSVAVDQSFGNCPQYIQTRSIDFVHEPNTEHERSSPVRFEAFDDEARALIETADTFFVSSYLQADDTPEVEGVDVSHRGGRPGFVKIDRNTLTIPDYSGNSHFNTLGNFLLNPKAGLVFPDFSTGDLLMLTGTVELLWEDAAEIKAFAGAERGWRFTLYHGLRLPAALPFRSTFHDYSPSSLITGDWAQAEATLEAEARRNAWRPYRVTRIEDESSVIQSFYLKPADGGAILPFEAGQFLTISIAVSDTDKPAIRTYTVSSAPGETHYRISVKREVSGQVSRLFHDTVKVGSLVEVKAPRGGFYIDPAETRPAVLLGGGVGITPMISMAQHIVKEGRRTRHFRKLTILHAAKTLQERAFAASFRNLEAQSNGAVQYRSFISRPANRESSEIDAYDTGHLTPDILRQTLPLDDYDFYLCGPAPFMQALYDTLRKLGVRDNRIFAEAFGPASLKRQQDGGGDTVFDATKEAGETVIKFAKSDFEQRWNRGGDTILETAETHGLTPDSGCRNGNCGTCAVKLKSGSVTYRVQPSAVIAEDEVLICCAVPAKGADVLEIDL